MKYPFKSEEFSLYAYCFLQLVKMFEERNNNIYDVVFIICTLSLAAYFVSKILTDISRKKDVSSADQQSQLKTKEGEEENE